MRHLVTLLLAFVVLTGCAAIPYERPEDQAAIQKDLSVKPEDIVTMTQVYWCSNPYGDITPCQLQDALAIQTRTKLILATFSSQHYKPAMQTLASDVMCAHAENSRDTSPQFYLFTKDYALQVWPLNHDFKPEMEKKKLMLDAMTQGKTTFVGPQGNFVENTGRVNETMAVIPNTAIPYTTRTTIFQLINPCQVKS